jgi:hypothetical protein
VYGSTSIGLIGPISYCDVEAIIAQLSDRRKSQVRL